MSLIGSAVTNYAVRSRIVLEVRAVTSMVLDSQTADKIRVVGERVELHDANGNLLGFFLPAVNLSQSKMPDCPFTDEEIEKLRQQRGARSLAEIMNDLRKIA
jgi:hypothetical protein